MWPDIRTAAYAETGRNRFHDTHWADVSHGASIGNHVRAVDGGLWKHGAMAGYAISESNKFTHTELVGLYASVGWTSYANDPETLARAVDQSSFVVSARDLTGQLVGLARAVSDDVSVCYLQDILVGPGQQRSGIGKALVDRMLERYGHVRQKVLLTDDEPGQRAFYESLGFIEAHDFGPTPLRAFVQIGFR